MAGFRGPPDLVVPVMPIASMTGRPGKVQRGWIHRSGSRGEVAWDDGPVKTRSNVPVPGCRPSRQALRATCSRDGRFSGGRGWRGEKLGSTNVFEGLADCSLVAPAPAFSSPPYEGGVRGGPGATGPRIAGDRTDPTPPNPPFVRGGRRSATRPGRAPSPVQPDFSPRQGEAPSEPHLRARREPRPPGERHLVPASDPARQASGRPGVGRAPAGPGPLCPRPGSIRPAGPMPILRVRPLPARLPFMPSVLPSRPIRLGPVAGGPAGSGPRGETRDGFRSPSRLKAAGSGRARRAGRAGRGRTPAARRPRARRTGSTGPVPRPTGGRPAAFIDDGPGDPSAGGARVTGRAGPSNSKRPSSQGRSLDEPPAGS